MITHRVTGILGTPEILAALSLYERSTNLVELDGHQQLRHQPSSIGHFMVSYFSETEFEFVLEKLRKHFNSRFVPRSCRILQYSPGGFIPSHVDVNSNPDDPSNLSVIIQITDPRSYAGGDIVVNKQLVELDVGDAYIYEYGVEHEVRKIRSGNRLMINIRGFVYNK